jgi:CheY-like chemotaxis protein
MRAAPDAVVLDLQLPHLDGAGFIRELRDHPGRGRVPLLVVSGAAQAADAADRLGADALVRKPFDLDELLGAVHRVSHARA